MFRNIHSKLFVAILTAGFTFGLPIASQAGLYKYVDENGNVVYSQTPPPSGDYKSVKLPKESRKQKLTAEEREAKRKKAREAILGKEQEDENADSGTKSSSPTGPSADEKESKLVKDEARKNKKERQELCKRARENKRKLEVYRRFRDEDGKVVRFSDEERAKRLKSANDAIKQFCG